MKLFTGKNMLLCCMLLTLGLTDLYAQDNADTKDKKDTLRVGNFLIVRKAKSNTAQKGNNEANESISNRWQFKYDRNYRKVKRHSTQWLNFDIGFANINDQTNYTTAVSKGFIQQGMTKQDFSIRSGRSMNVNIWFVTQEEQFSRNRYSLKYGLGLEMYNYYYQYSPSFRTYPEAHVYMDSISFSKNKLYAGYLTVPVTFNFKFSDNLQWGLGMSAGYLVGSRNKQISSERGKQIYTGSLGLDPWRIAVVSDLKLGLFRFYGSYSINSLFQPNTGVKQYPYVFGLRFIL